MAKIADESPITFSDKSGQYADVVTLQAGFKALAAVWNGTTPWPPVWQNGYNLSRVIGIEEPVFRAHEDHSKAELTGNLRLFVRQDNADMLALARKKYEDLLRAGYAVFFTNPYGPKLLAIKPESLVYAEPGHPRKWYPGGITGRELTTDGVAIEIKRERDWERDEDIGMDLRVLTSKGVQKDKFHVSTERQCSRGTVSHSGTVRFFFDKTVDRIEGETASCYLPPVKVRRFGDDSAFFSRAERTGSITIETDEQVLFDSESEFRDRLADHFFAYPEPVEPEDPADSVE